jgi:hypothetical protein
LRIRIDTLAAELVVHLTGRSAFLGPVKDEGAASARCRSSSGSVHRDTPISKRFSVAPAARGQDALCKTEGYAL